MVDEFNIMIAGVGGQGVILMSELLGNAAVTDGLQVRGSEVLGMAVRGGSVSSTIRLGNGVFGPLTPMGKCDILVGMEPSEALRNISFLSSSSMVIVNAEMVFPYTVSLGQSSYPPLDKIIEELNGAAGKVITLKAVEIAREAGSHQSANIVVLGAIFGTGRLPISMETIKAGIQSRFSAKLAPINLKAFDLGYQVTAGA